MATFQGSVQVSSVAVVRPHLFVDYLFSRQLLPDRSLLEPIYITSSHSHCSISTHTMSAVEDTPSDVKVDDTPISPVDRRSSLEKHLQHRPDAQDLKNRHILLDSNAAP